MRNEKKQAKQALFLSILDAILSLSFSIYFDIPMHANK